MIMVMRGTITRTGRRPSVEVPDLGVGYDFGPCETISSEDYDRGDRVLVASVGDIPEDVVILGRMAPEDEDEGGRSGWLWRRLDPRYAFKSHTHSQSEVVGLVPRLLGIEGDVDVVEGRATVLESRASLLESRATSVEADVLGLGGQVGDLEDALAGLEAPGAGMSAYELAVEEGFEGTVGEWLASLEGSDGRAIVSVVRTAGTGAAGSLDTYTITYSDASESTFQVRNGTNGTNGRGIMAITRTSGTGAAGSTDTYTITYSDASTSTFTVVNGSNGTNGTNGTNGRGISSIARTAGTGAAGTTDTYTITYSDATTSTFTVVNGANGTNGTNGTNGRGISSIARTSGTGAAGTTDTYTITYTDASTSTFTVVNGANGAGAGDVSGPASSVDGRVAMFSGTTGKLLADTGLLASSLVLTSGAQTITGPKTLEAAAGGTAVLGARVAGNANNRVQVDADGTIRWGDGTATTDVALSRTAAGVVQVAGTFKATGQVWENGQRVFSPSNVVHTDYVATEWDGLLTDDLASIYSRLDTLNGSPTYQTPGSSLTDSILVSADNFGTQFKDSGVKVSDLARAAGGGAEVWAAPSATSGAITLNCAVGNGWKFAPTGAITGITLSNVPTTPNRISSWSLLIEQGATLRNVTWPAAWKWLSAVPVQAVGKACMVTIETWDGTTFYASGVVQP